MNGFYNATGLWLDILLEVVIPLRMNGFYNLHEEQKA